MSTNEEEHVVKFECKFIFFVYFCMLYYENNDTPEITNIYSNNKASLAIHFSVLHSCDQKGYTQATLYGQKLYAQIF